MMTEVFHYAIYPLIDFHIRKMYIIHKTKWGLCLELIFGVILQVEVFGGKTGFLTSKSLIILANNLCIEWDTEFEIF